MTRRAKPSRVEKTDLKVARATALLRNHPLTQIPVTSAMSPISPRCARSARR